jgi:ABC-2 type transport system permease protein
MGAIYKRDLESHFNSMIGYIYTAVVVFLVGIFFVANNLNSGYPYFSSVLSSTLFLFIIATPILTMRSLSEERRAKTDQLLLTYPFQSQRSYLASILP